MLTGSQTIHHDPHIWVGEGLLKHDYAIETVVKNDANHCIDWCKSSWNRDNDVRLSNNSFRNDLPLQRPTTPSQRSARNSISENHPSIGNRNQLYVSFYKYIYIYVCIYKSGVVRIFLKIKVGYDATIIMIL